MAEARVKLRYEDKFILAPMVRIGTLPMRLLALDYGADIVYTEELIDFKLLRSTRRENGLETPRVGSDSDNEANRQFSLLPPEALVGRTTRNITQVTPFDFVEIWKCYKAPKTVLGTIDYVDRTDGTIVFRTCNRERDRVVLQLGTSDATRALKVGRMVENDVAGIDINMGCPKKFSINGGMGAALLRDAEKAKGILKTLVDALNIPVTCKIRVFSDMEKTLNLCDVLVSSGISAIAVHGRTIDERPQHPNRNEAIFKIAQHLSIPVIANGGSRDIEKYKDIEKFKEDTGASSVMLARAAQWNCSIFRKQGLLPMEDVLEGYLRYAVDYDNAPSNTKYCVQNIIRDLQESPTGKKFLTAQTLEQICDVWGMGDYCRLKSAEYQKMGLQGRFHVTPASQDDHDGLSTSKRKFNDPELTVMRCAYLKNNYSNDDELPKTRLYRWVRENKKKMPEYDTWYEDKLFRSIVTVDGKKYSSTFWEKNKKWAEQGAALVCLCAMDIIDKETLRKSGNLLGSDGDCTNETTNSKRQKST